MEPVTDVTDLAILLLAVVAACCAFGVWKALGRLWRFVKGPPPIPASFDRPASAELLRERMAAAHALEEREHRQAMRRAVRHG